VGSGEICIGMVAAGSASDRLGAELIGALQGGHTGLRFAGIAGPRMRARGAESVVPMERLSAGLRRNTTRREQGAKGVATRLIDRLLAEQATLFLGIELPEFNLEVARRLKSAGVRTLQYAGLPASMLGRARLRSIARAVDRVLTVFPFEPEIYARAGVAATYVGHPLADAVPVRVDKAAARTQLRLPHGKLIVALVPRARPDEMGLLAEVFVKTARRFFEEVKDVHFLVPASTREGRDVLETALRLHAHGDVPVNLLFGHSHEALAAADLALVTGGTAALEAMLFKTPMVITGRASGAQAWLARLRRTPRPTGLPNLLAGEWLVPELLQAAATPWALSAALIALMRDRAALRRQTERFQDLHQTLRQGNVLKLRDAVLGALERGPG